MPAHNTGMGKGCLKGAQEGPQDASRKLNSVRIEAIRARALWTATSTAEDRQSFLVYQRILRGRQSHFTRYSLTPYTFPLPFFIAPRSNPSPALEERSPSSDGVTEDC